MRCLVSNFLVSTNKMNCCKFRFLEVWKKFFLQQSRHGYNHILLQTLPQYNPHCFYDCLTGLCDYRQCPLSSSETMD